MRNSGVRNAPNYEVRDVIAVEVAGKDRTGLAGHGTSGGKLCHLKRGLE
jgi:hypothetical protein